jgi:hypothetical protein
MIRFQWQINSECHHPGSSPEFRPESEGGTIEAESAGDALVKIITGQGDRAMSEDVISWDAIDQARPITITIRADL